MKYLYLGLLCLAAAGLFLYTEKQKRYVLALILKGAASLCFLLLGIFSSKLSQNTFIAEKTVTGLCLGFTADILLNLRFILKNIGQKVFLLGILVFLAGHILYIIALLPISSNIVVCLIAGVILTGILICWTYRQITTKPVFKIFGVFYLGAITIMTCIACGILITNPTTFSYLFSIGALFFLASDIILILNTFGSESRQFLRISNILLYYLGQLLIAFSLQFI